MFGDKYVEHTDIEPNTADEDSFEPNMLGMIGAGLGALAGFYEGFSLFSSIGGYAFSTFVGALIGFLLGNYLLYLIGFFVVVKILDFIF